MVNDSNIYKQRVGEQRKNNKNRLIIERMKEMWDESGKIENPMEAVHFSSSDKPVDEKVYDDIADEVSERLSLNENDDLLEVGCGNGLLLQRLKNRVKSIVGVDFSKEMLKGIKDPSIKTYQAEANTLPFSDHSFDKVICHSIFHYFPDLEYAEESVLEMVRVCKPNGQILISDVLNGYLKEIYLEEEKKKLSLQEKIKNILLQSCPWLRHIRRIIAPPLFIEPIFFKKLFLNNKYKVYILLETVESKPKPFLMFRYDVLIFKIVK